MSAAAPVQAAEPAVSFQIVGSSLRAELVQLATEARVSFSLKDPGRCAGAGTPLTGRFTVDAALDRLLQGSGATWRRLGPNVFEITCGKAAKPPQPGKPPVSAPRVAAPDAVELTPLVVVATRRPTPADRLAYSVTAVEEPTLVSQGVRDLSDLALLTPAMTVTNLGMGRDKILLRGLSDGPLTGRTQSMVGLYLDDVRLTYSAPDPDLRLVDLASVEVLRGPQGASYGAGSLGGVVHLVTAQPDPTRFSGWIAATGATTDGGAGSRSADAVLNAPLPGERAALRLVVYEEFDGGYIDDTALHLSNVNRSERAGARLAYKTGLGADWDLTAGLVAQTISSKDSQYALAGAPAYTRANHVGEPHENNFDEANVRLHGRLDGAEVRWSTAYVLHSLYSRYDATAASKILIPADPAAYDDRNRIETLLTEGTITSAASAKTQWLLGMFAARSLQRTGSDLTALGAKPVAVLDERRRDRLDEAALFGEAVVPIARSLDVTVGGRLFASQDKVASRVAAPRANATSLYASRVGETGVAPKLVLAYHPSPVALVYAQAAKGYRPGGINTLRPRHRVPGPLHAFRTYDSDRLWSFEAGGKLALLSDSLRLRGAVFEVLWKNIQSDLILPSGLPYTANLGEGSNHGVELESAYRWRGLDLKGQLVLNRPELNRANPVTFPRRGVVGLAVVPDVSLGVSADYVRPLPGDRSLELDARWDYVGGSRLLLDPTIAPKMGDYSTGRLAASLLAGPWRWTVSVDNPLDSRGNTFGYGNPFGVRSAREVTPLRPRTVSVGFRRDF